MQVLDINRILSIEYFIVCHFSTRILELNIQDFAFSCFICKSIMKPLDPLVAVSMEFHDMSPHLFHTKIFEAARFTSVRLIFSMHDLLVLH